MKNNVRKRIFTALLAVALSWGVMVAGAAAVTVSMEANTTTVTMPGGEVVTMWGYAIPADADYATAFGPNGPPVIKLTTGDSLTISLTNNLTEPTSVIIPGQKADTMVPTWIGGATGNRAGDLTKRVRSFTHETASAATVSYTWTTLKAGTYLIQSGTHPSVQIQMGLYAVLIVDEGAAGMAYSSITYDYELALLFSEIDPYLHAAVAGGTYGTAAYMTTMMEGYRARYFLINGKPYTAGQSPFAFDVGASNRRVILRFLNAGLRDRVPVVQGGVMKMVAEDGNPVPYAGAAQQYSVDLAPGKTMDAVFIAGVVGYIPVYDRRLGLSNDLDSPGGMLAFLQFGDPAWLLTVAKDGSGTGTVQTVSLPGGIDFGTDNSEFFLFDTEVTLHATGDLGSTLTGWVVTDSLGAMTGECQAPLAHPQGDCVVVMTDDKIVTATFNSFSVVTLVAPNGAETIAGGSGYEIAWGAPANAVTFTLGYSFGVGSPWKTIASGVTGDRYLWVIPETIPNHGELYVVVMGYDSTGALVGTDTSDAASNRNSIALVTPSASGLVLSVDPVPYDITWTSSMVSGTVANIGIWFQTAPGTAWELITVLTSDTGLYPWTVPADVTTEALVGVIFYDSLGDVLHMDVSDNMFEMNTP